MLDFYQQLTAITEQVPVIIQLLVTAAWGAIPFVESEFAAGIAVIAGVVVVPAIIAAVIGNILSVVLVIVLADKVREWRRSHHIKESSERQKKVKRAIHKYGIPGASLAGPLITGTHAMALIAMASGAPRRTVIIWQIIAITVWGVIGGVLAAIGVDILASRA